MNYELISIHKKLIDYLYYQKLEIIKEIINILNKEYGITIRN